EDRLGAAALAGFFGAGAGCATAAAITTAVTSRAPARSFIRAGYPPSGRYASEEDVRAQRDRGAGLAGGVVAEVRAGRGLLDVDHVQVQPPLPAPVGIEARSPPDLPRMALEVVENVPRHGVEAERAGDDHVHGFREEALVPDRAHRQRSV